MAKELHYFCSGFSPIKFGSEVRVRGHHEKIKIECLDDAALVFAMRCCNRVERIIKFCRASSAVMTNQIGHDCQDFYYEEEGDEPGLGWHIKVSWAEYEKKRNGS